MANALLFYRTLTTDKTTVPDPNDLPDEQKFLFTPPDDLTSGIDESWDNNIVRKVPTQPGGRKLIQTDEGFKGWIITLSGNYIVGSSNQDKLFDFTKLVQSDSFHELGNFGILYPNGPNYLNIDPDDEKGLMIMNRTGKHIGITKEIFHFSVTISFGGTA